MAPALRLPAFLCCATVSLCFFAGGATGRPPAPANEAERLVSLLRDSIEVKPDRRRPGTDVATTGLVHDDQLAALRLLRDPDLRPLFQSLAESEHPQLRLHGLLGCAELDPARGLDTFQLKRVKSPIEQAFLFGQAARHDLVGVEQCREVLAWPGIGPELEVQARARLLRLGEAPGADRLKALAQNESLPIAAMSALMLLQSGDTESAAAAIERFFASPEPARVGALPTVLSFIKREGLTAGAQFVERVIDISDGYGGVRLEAVHTLLTIAPEKGAERWTAIYALATELTDQILLGLAALDGSENASGSLYDPLAAESNELLSAMGRAGRAVALKQGAQDALLDLVRLNHPPSIGWAVDSVKDLPAEHQPVIDRALIAGAIEAPRSATVRRLALSPAAVRLAESDPQAFAALVGESAAREDDVLCQTLLAGALRSKAPTPPLPDSAVRWPSAECRSLALLLKARFEPALGEDDLAALRLVALGSDLSRLFRVQAAWLALRHAGQDRVCLAKVLAPEPE